MMEWISDQTPSWSSYPGLWLPPPLEALVQAASKDEVPRFAVEFARFVYSLEAEARREDLEAEQQLEQVTDTALAAFLAALSIHHSHTCLSLTEMGIEAVASELVGTGAAMALGIEEDVLPPREWFSSLAIRLKAAVEEAHTVGGAADGRCMVLHGQRLYLHRYFRYEVRLSEAFHALATERPWFEPGAFEGIGLLRRIFGLSGKGDAGVCGQAGGDCPTEPDLQALSVLCALRRRLTVVSGGPGTGKTRTVTALVAVAQKAAMAEGRPLDIALCAPTGKAAARLLESVRSAIQALEIPADISVRLPSESFTLHRLLGSGRNPGSFRYGKDRPLPHGLVVVDEASMVDMPMMAHLLDALGPDASLVLLGDQDQLASVEAGSVFRDLCSLSELSLHGKGIASLAEQAGLWLPEPLRGEAPHPVAACTVKLQKNYRFGAGSGIHALAQAVNQGDVAKAVRLLGSGGNGGMDGSVAFVSDDEEPLEGFLMGRCRPWVQELLSCDGPGPALEVLGRLKILCFLRQGRHGVAHANRLLDGLCLEMAQAGSRLEEDGAVHGRLLGTPVSLYRARPVIITRNDYQAGLYNGDTGVCWPDSRGRLKVWFEDPAGGLRAFSPARLPPWEPAWAMTVHRSQGSEFREVLVVLPPAETAWQGREILYTAITRARSRVEVWGTIEGLSACIGQRTWRESGLADTLRALDGFDG